MKNVTLFFILIVLLPSVAMAVEVPRTGQRTCFDQYGGVIDHVDSGQDGELQSGAIWPEPRFEDNGDGTVTDNLSGLMWMYDGGCLGAMSWPAAMQCSHELNAPEEYAGAICKLEAGCKDWFLPGIEQLETLFNGEEPSIADWLASWGIGNIQQGHYWSTTTAPNPYTAWGFHFDSGETVLTAKVTHGFVLLARRVGSLLVPPQKQDPEPSPKMTTFRFIDNGDGTVTDMETSLMWLTNAACLEPAGWRESFETINRLNNDPLAFDCVATNYTYTDWSLPNRNELRSLVDHGRDFPALPEYNPFVNVQPGYWTSTTAAQSPAQAYKLFMATGEVLVADKVEMGHVWPVRSVDGRISRVRTSGKTQEQVYEKVHSMFHVAGERKMVSWPALRFTDKNDGTLVDNISGLMWLKDSGCLGQQQWGMSFRSVRNFNWNPALWGCKEYTQAYQDWYLPDLETLTELIGSAPEEPAQWLEQQGAAGVPARDFWSVTENLLNMYYAWALNMKQGTPRNYPKTFPLFVWPVRKPQNSGWVHPKPTIRVNNSLEKLQIVQGEDIILTAAISGVDNILEADFSIWYEAPDKSRWWLSNTGEWQSEEMVLYRGNLFPLADYVVFSGRTTGMATGLYILHFDISILNKMDDLVPLFSTVFSTTFSLGIDTAIPNQANLLWYPDNK